MTQTDNTTARLKAQKAALLDCINEAKTDEELTAFVNMLSKFTFLHPEI